MATVMEIKKKTADELRFSLIEDPGIEIAQENTAQGRIAIPVLSVAAPSRMTGRET